MRPTARALRHSLGLLAGLAFSLAAHAADASAPATPVRPVTDTYHGTAVVDPYRWMEDMGSSDFKDWLQAQAGHAGKVLAQIPGREALHQRLTALSAEAGESNGTDRTSAS